MHTRRILLAAFMAVGLIGGTGALAAPLDDYRAAGVIGERPDGLIGAVGSPSAEVAAFIERVNAERMAEYRRVAQQTNAPVGSVQAIMGQKLIDRVPPGTYVMSASGQWVRK